ncbi:phage tail fiber domain-containing protein [Maritalea mediterranea]|uniref:Bacteriophage T7 tail fibre protein-like N-terminal domain-containing protein n=1 Tax=Maritalea mediterranea TaxID=2909667 RepID=A0ABS9E9M7_9HYPH|nr:phage tail fiber protein [Maritalea mediterranea]MCF4098609.1 hypothetical protein [Maritalea mediterranea]
MAKSYDLYPDANGSLTDFAINFEYLDASHVKATVDGVPASFTFLSTYMVRMDTPPVGDLKIYRQTPTDEPINEFVDGSVLIDDDLNRSFFQSLFISEEVADASLQQDIDGQWDAANQVLKNLAQPKNDQDAATKKYVEDRFGENAANLAATQAAQAAAEAARDTAQTYRDEADADRQATEAAQTAAETARDVTQGYRDEADLDRIAAENAKTAAETARDVTQSYRDEADADRIAAQAAASTATTKASEASVSAAAASLSESNAATSETNSANSENVASTKASEASTSASTALAAQSASETARDVTLGYRDETNAHRLAAETAKTAAETARNTTETYRDQADADRIAAQDAATTATTKAAEASASASAASTSETNAANSEALAFNHLSEFEAWYLGKMASDPAGVEGQIYWNTTEKEMRAHNGTQWVAAYVTLGGALINSNNLSDLTDASLARTNLGLGNVENTSDADKPVSVAQQAALDGKADKSSTYTKTEVDSALSGKSETGHGHSISDISGLQTALDGKSNTGHGHSISDVSGLQTALDDKSSNGHGHSISDVSGLQSALDGKSATGHGHSIGDISGLSTELGTKVDKDTNSRLDAGYETNAADLGSSSGGNFYPSPSQYGRNFGRITNNGNFTLTKDPSTLGNSYTFVLLVENAAGGGGAVTIVGFDKVNNDDFTTAANAKMMIYIHCVNGVTSLSVEHIQG